MAECKTIEPPADPNACAARRARRQQRWQEIAARQAHVGPDAMLQMPAVVARVALCPSSIYARIALGTFPRQVHLSDGCVRWRAGDIEVWLNLVNVLGRKLDKETLERALAEDRRRRADLRSGVVKGVAEAES